MLLTNATSAFTAKEYKISYKSLTEWWTRVGQEILSEWCLRPGLNIFLYSGIWLFCLMNLLKLVWAMRARNYVRSSFSEWVLRLGFEHRIFRSLAKRTSHSANPWFARWLWIWMCDFMGSLVKAWVWFAFILGNTALLQRCIILGEAFC